MNRSKLKTIKKIELKTMKKRKLNIQRFKEYRVVRYYDDSYLITLEERKGNKIYYPIFILREKRKDKFVYHGKGRNTKKIRDFVDGLIEEYKDHLRKKKMYFDIEEIEMF